LFLPIKSEKIPVGTSNKAEEIIDTAKRLIAKVKELVILAK
ncbi:MAG: hypothetical protein UR23_C0014G0011, partial [Candidatus Roizmanbacteria bacterium GW2011_GWA2_32_13]